MRLLPFQNKACKSYAVRVDAVDAARMISHDCSLLNEQTDVKISGAPGGKLRGMREVIGQQSRALTLSGFAVNM